MGSAVKKIGGAVKKAAGVATPGGLAGLVAKKAATGDKKITVGDVAGSFGASAGGLPGGVGGKLGADATGFGDATLLSGIGGNGGPGPTLNSGAFNVQDIANRYETMSLGQGQEAAARNAAIQSPQLLAQLRQTALGQGPSLAEAQLKSATTRNLAQQLAAAASMRGRNPAAVQRQVLRQQGAAGRELADMSAQARLQETQAAQQQLMQAQAQADALAAQAQERGFAQALAPKQARQDYEMMRFNADVAKSNAIRNQQTAILGGLLGAGGQIGGGAAQGLAMSDESQKTNVKNASKDISKFLESLNAKSYKYKDTSKPGTAPGKRVGVMAQDLEKSDAGKSIVKDTPNGKMVDTVQGFGLVVAAQKQLHDRIKALESKKKGNSMDDKAYAQQLLGLSPEALTELEQEGAPGIDSTQNLATDMTPAVPESPIPPVPTPAAPGLATQAGQLVGDYVVNPIVDRYKAYADLAQKGMNVAGDFAQGVGNAVVPPVAQPSIVAPAPVVEPNPVETQAVAQAVDNATQPEPARVEEHKQNLLAPIKEERAVQEAHKQVKNDIKANLLKQQDELEKQQKALDEQMNRTDNSVRARSLTEILSSGTWGEKLGASIALLVGGISQGLTGAKTNPVMDFIDRQVEQQGQKDKLRAEEKLSLRKLLLDKAQLRVQALKAASDDVYQKGVLDQTDQKLAIEKQDNEFKQRLLAEEQAKKYNSAQLSAMYDAGQPVPNLAGLSEDQRKRGVRLPDGSWKTVSNPAVAEKLNDFVNQVEPAAQGAQRILALSQDFNRVTDLKKRAEINTEIKALMGQLRLAFAGPGALTDKEATRLLDTIGDPTRFTSWPSLEQAKLQTVLNKLNTDTKLRYKQAGIDLPKTQREILIEKYRK